jgi:hypothetical protein
LVSFSFGERAESGMFEKTKLNIKSHSQKKGMAFFIIVNNEKMKSEKLVGSDQLALISRKLTGKSQLFESK